MGAVEMNTPAIGMKLQMKTNRLSRPIPGILRIHMPRAVSAVLAIAICACSHDQRHDAAYQSRCPQIWASANRCFGWSRQKLLPGAFRLDGPAARYIATFVPTLLGARSLMLTDDQPCMLSYRTLAGLSGRQVCVSCCEYRSTSREKPSSRSPCQHKMRYACITLGEVHLAPKLIASCCEREGWSKCDVKLVDAGAQLEAIGTSWACLAPGLAGPCQRGRRRR